MNDDNIEKVKQTILEKFSDSIIRVANQYPCASQIEAICTRAIEAAEEIL